MDSSPRITPYQRATYIAFITITFAFPFETKLYSLVKFSAVALVFALLLAGDAEKALPGPVLDVLAPFIELAFLANSSYWFAQVVQEFLKLSPFSSGPTSFVGFYVFATSILYFLLIIGRVKADPGFMEQLLSNMSALKETNSGAAKAVGSFGTSPTFVNMVANNAILHRLGVKSIQTRFNNTRLQEINEMPPEKAAEESTKIFSRWIHTLGSLIAPIIFLVFTSLTAMHLFRLPPTFAALVAVSFITTQASILILDTDLKAPTGSDTSLSSGIYISYVGYTFFAFYLFNTLS